MLLLMVTAAAVTVLASVVSSVRAPSMFNRPLMVIVPPEVVMFAPKRVPLPLLIVTLLPAVVEVSMAFRTSTVPAAPPALNSTLSSQL